MIGYRLNIINSKCITEGGVLPPSEVGSPRFSGVSPSFSGVFSDFTNFSGRAPHFLGVVPELLLLPVFTSFFCSSSPFSGVGKETPDFSLASPDFPEALPVFPVPLKSPSLFYYNEFTVNFPYTQ